VSAGFLTLAALTRQSWLWAAPFFAVLALEPLWRPRPPTWFGLGGASAELAGSAAGRAAPFLLPVLVCLPIFIVWGGLVPMNWHDVNQARGVSLEAVAFAFVLLGLYALVVVPSELVRLFAWRRVLVALVVAIALGVASRLHHASLFTDEIL
jgi:hypothetical protein